MIRLILMRHGNTFEAGEVARQVGARTDLPLTGKGREQAEAMARYLEEVGLKPGAIFAGSLKRQMETATIVGRGMGVLQELALNEIDYGPWEGLTSEEIQRKWPKEYEEWTEGKWQGLFGGSREGHWKAIEEWLGRLRKAKGDVFLAVTSNGLLRFFRNEKVKTGHFCEIVLLEDSYKIEKWNIDPLYGRQNSMA